MSSRVEVVSNRFGAIAEATRREIVEALKEAAFSIEAGAKEAVPVDTGALRASIQADVDRAATDLYAEVVVGEEYAEHVELGTVHQKAQPFLSPVSEAEREQFKRRVADAVRRGSEQAGGR